MESRAPGFAHRPHETILPSVVWLREQLEASPDPVRRDRPQELEAQPGELEREVEGEKRAMLADCALRPESQPADGR